MIVIHISLAVCQIHNMIHCMKEIKYGYARVSTSQQSLKIQKDKLKEQGVDADRIFTDKKSGKNNDRAGLQSLMDACKRSIDNGDGDTSIHLFCTRMDRLGRSTLDMLDLIKGFDELGVKVTFIDDGITTGNVHAEMIMTILTAVATAERKRILERTEEGRIDALARGIKFGAKKTIDDDKVIEYSSNGMGATDIARELGISRASVYRALRKEA